MAVIRSSSQERGDGVLGAEAGLVADGDHAAQAQAALLEREVDGHVAALVTIADATFVARRMPCSSGHSATRSNVLTKP